MDKIKRAESKSPTRNLLKLKGGEVIISFGLGPPEVAPYMIGTLGEVFGPRNYTGSESRPVCDRIGNSGRNRNRIAMIWPELEPDCHPKKVVGFDRIGRIKPDLTRFQCWILKSSNFGLCFH